MSAPSPERGDERGGGGPPPWHAVEATQALSALDVKEQGLGQKEAERRLEEHGGNELPTLPRASPLRRFVRQLNNVLIYVLLVAAVFTAFLGEWVDTAVILAVVLINAVVGFVQEGKAERAMESIRGMLAPHATVLRDGNEKELPATELVPGDVVVMRAGDRVPADVRLFAAKNVQVEEAPLTGESEAVGKQVEPVEPDAELGDRASMAFSSTVLTSGQARGVVVATGRDTEIGHISQMVSEVEQLNTPLLRRIDAFGRKLSATIGVVAVAVFAVGYFVRGFSASELFMAVVGLAVAAIPEGLPAIMTITLALGVRRMAERNAIIRRLPAVETLGSVTVICSDKTGTLTRNEMTVAKVALSDALYAVSGAGYEPKGTFRLDEQDVDPKEDPRLEELARAGLLASDARLFEEAGQWRIDGMPTEGSLVVLAHKVGLARETERKEHPRIDTIPFASERRYMASLHEDSDGERVLYVKGAPERLLELCTRQRTPGGEAPLDRRAWEERADELADHGHRVLALATKPWERGAPLEEDQVKELTLLGLVGIIDPPREEAVDAIREARDAGIRVKMITGDHALTARSIGASMGIGDGEHVVTGKDVQSASDEELPRLVHDNDVFARASPEHKLRMIQALQARDEIVAMTGDGVNDAPALKRADVGVAMGIKGSEAAKEAAEMVLADDNFATIEQAVKEGRTIYDNLLKTILFILPTNGAEALLVMVPILFLFDSMPVTPVQILWVNMVTAVTLALALAFEPAEEGIMQRPPRSPGEPIVSPYLVWRVAFVSVVIATLALLLFRRATAMGASLDEARSVAVNTLVAGQVFYLFNSRFLIQPSLSPSGLLGNRKALLAVGVLVVLQLGFTYLPPSQAVFGTASLAPTSWLWILGAGLVVFLLVELEKQVRRWRR